MKIPKFNLVLSYSTGLVVASALKYETRFFTQPVDHLNLQNTLTYNQKILVNYDYWNSTNNDPIFFYTGNEGPIEAFTENSGFIEELAKIYNAGLVFAEHRYYGDSLPFGPDQSFEINNLGYLSSDQAMADFASIITGYLPNKVIAFGGSYGGMLAGYMRFKYPHLVYGAVAASAPIKWIHFPDESSEISPVQGKLRFTPTHVGPKCPTKITGNFFSEVTKDYTQHTPECSARLKSGFDQLKNLIDNSKFDEIVTRTKQCNSEALANTDGVWHIAEWLRNIFVTMAMMDYPYQTDFMWPLPPWPVDVACQVAMDHNPENLDNLDFIMKAITVAYNMTEQDCYDARKDYIHCADPTGCGLGPAATAWDYQACTEFFLPGHNPRFTSDMFIHSLPSRWNSTTRNIYCQNKYKVTPDNFKLAITYSLLQDSSRIIFSNGGRDPWGAGGVDGSDYFIDNGEKGKDMYSFFIPSGAHHLDLRGSHEGDPEDVIQVRNAYKEIIGRWLK